MRSDTPKTCTFHGFLGDPRDFFGVCKSATHIDLNSEELLTGNYKVALERIYRRLSPESPLLGIGYSMGARVALWLDSLFPTLFSSLLLLSVNPGPSSKIERRERMIRDEEWSRRFLTEESPSVIRAWNSQPVFHGTTVKWREYDKKVASTLISQWSVSRQPDLMPHLEKISKRTVLMFGERDEKYVELGSRIGSLNNPNLEIAIVKNCGHRILEDQPGEVKKALRRIKR